MSSGLRGRRVCKTGSSWQAYDYGPKRTRKNEDPAMVSGIPLPRASEPECRILMFMWSLEDLEPYCYIRYELLSSYC